MLVFDRLGESINFKHTIMAEVISCKAMLELMKFKQQPILIEEDDKACVDAAIKPNMTKGSRYLQLTEMFFKEKLANDTKRIIKITSGKNCADLGTKGLMWPTFSKLVCQIVTCTNSFFQSRNFHI